MSLGEYEIAAIRSISAETERQCWRAIGKGVGWRVWRSEPEMKGFTITYRFVLLPPGEPAPGRGVIFGPFSNER